MDNEIKEIRLEDIVPFKYHSGQTYEGTRLRQLMDSIERVGLATAIIVRPIDNGKYETICGHNRVKAAKALGYNAIKADIKYDLSDEKALELFFDSNLNQQSFSDWNYSQKIEAIQYSEKIIRETSRQGKRTDLEKTANKSTDGETSVHGRQKLNKSSKKPTARDKMAHRLGISTATLSKYRRIIKLPDDLIQSISHLLDEGRITFKAAYVISNLRDIDIKWLIEGIEEYPDRELDLNKLKELPLRSTVISNDEIYPVSKELVLNALIRPASSKIIDPIRVFNKQ